MTPEKQEVSLVMQRDHLSALELGHGGGNIFWNTLRTVCSNLVTKFFKISVLSTKRDPAI